MKSDAAGLRELKFEIWLNFFWSCSHLLGMGVWPKHRFWRKNFLKRLKIGVGRPNFMIFHENGRRRRPLVKPTESRIPDLTLVHLFKANFWWSWKKKCWNLGVFDKFERSKRQLLKFFSENARCHRNSGVFGPFWELWFWYTYDIGRVW